MENKQVKSALRMIKFMALYQYYVEKYDPCFIQHFKFAAHFKNLAIKHKTNGKRNN